MIILKHFNANSHVTISLPHKLFLNKGIKILSETKYLEVFPFKGFVLSLLSELP